MVLKAEKNISLILFFTRGMSLKTWDRIGIFEREVALYRKLQKNNINITFVTYGDSSELDYRYRIPGIIILCNRWALPNRLYEYSLPWLFGLWLWKGDIIKTNQINGVDMALRVAHLWHKSLIVRCGYLWSSFAAYEQGEKSGTAHHAREIESNIFNMAKRVVVTTSAMAEYIKSQYHIPEIKVSVIPNYVLTDLFSPAETAPIPNRICFIGRLEDQKNPLIMVEACAGLDVELIIVGDGSLSEPIKEKAAQFGVKVQLLGNLPHTKLPEILRKSSIFLLASRYEGQPKSLLEAMACGLAVVATDAPGIRELIRHGENGLLCDQNAKSIQAAIQTLLSTPEKRTRLGYNARKFVLDHFSLERVASLEFSQLKEVCAY